VEIKVSNNKGTGSATAEGDESGIGQGRDRRLANETSLNFRRSDTPMLKAPVQAKGISTAMAM
jgi:hypothetical protein